MSLKTKSVTPFLSCCGLHESACRKLRQLALRLAAGQALLFLSLAASGACCPSPTTNAHFCCPILSGRAPLQKSAAEFVPAAAVIISLLRRGGLTPALIAIVCFLAAGGGLKMNVDYTSAKFWEVLLPPGGPVGAAALF